MEYRNFTAKTVDEAITAACLDLGVTSDKLEYDVIQEGSSGFLLGIGSRPAVIRARVRSEEEQEAEKKAIEAAQKASAPAPAPEAEKGEARIITNDEIEKRAAAAAARAKSEGRAPAEHAERPEKREKDGRSRRGRGSRTGAHERNVKAEAARSAAPVEEIPVPAHEPSKPKPEREIRPRTEEEAAVLKKAAEDFLKDVFAAMDIHATIETSYSQEEGSVNCIFDGDDMGLLIGKRGTTLDSLQYLTSLVVNKQSGDYIRVKLDTEDYRARRADALSNLARNIAYKVKRTRRPYSLEAMNPYERRIIHSSLQDNKFVETYSEGEEPYRHVVITPKR